MDLTDAIRDERQSYARWLRWSSRLGLSTVIFTFAAYVTGICPPYVPLQTVADLWGLPLDRYLAATDAPTGWNWLLLIDKGEYLGMTGIAVLGLATLFCYGNLSMRLVRRRENLAAAIAIAQMVVLVAAASGVIGVH